MKTHKEMPLQHHENNKNEKLPQLQEKRIAALMVCAANKVGHNEETTKKYWKIRSKTLKMK